jgi:hypothetical protein
MDKLEYYNDLMARMEELFFHELSDCAGWKTEFVGVDFIQSANVGGDSRDELIANSLKAMVDAGLIKGASFAIAGRDILLTFKVKGCQHMRKEAKLKERGIKIYNCIIANMLNDQLIEKLGYATAYVAGIEADEKSGLCQVQVAIYETPEKIGCVSDWNEERRRIDEEDRWINVGA